MLLISRLIAYRFPINWLHWLPFKHIFNHSNKYIRKKKIKSQRKLLKPSCNHNNRMQSITTRQKKKKPYTVVVNPLALIYSYKSQVISLFRWDGFHALLPSHSPNDFLCCQPPSPNVLVAVSVGSPPPTQQTNAAWLITIALSFSLSLFLLSFSSCYFSYIAVTSVPIHRVR